MKITAKTQSGFSLPEVFFDRMMTMTEDAQAKRKLFKVYETKVALIT